MVLRKVIAIPVLLSVMLGGCMSDRRPFEFPDVWSAAKDSPDDWAPEVFTSGEFFMVAWRDLTSRPRGVVLVGRGAKPLHALAAVKGGQVAIDSQQKIGTLSSDEQGSVSSGVLQVELQTGQLRQRTFDQPFGDWLPRGESWPSLFIAAGGALVWMANPIDVEGNFARVVVRLDAKGEDPHALARFAEISYMALSPDRRIIGVAGTRERGVKNSLFLVDIGSGKSQELLRADGVAWFAFDSAKSGYAVSGKPPIRRDVDADDFFDTQLFAPGTVVRWETEPARSTALPLELGGQSPNEVYVSPDGTRLAILTWWKPGRDDRRSHVWLVSLPNLSETNLTRRARQASDPMFSPRGRYLAFAEDEQLVRFRLADANRQEVFDDSVVGVLNAVPSAAWRSEDELVCFGIATKGPSEGRLALWISRSDARLERIAVRPASWSTV